MKVRLIAAVFLTAMLVSCGMQPALSPATAQNTSQASATATMPVKVSTDTPVPTATGTPLPTETATPEAPLLATEPYARIAAGGFHACAVTTKAGVQCWGFNRFGQLGNGRNTDRNLPSNVVGLSQEVVAVGAGWGTSCAITKIGGLKCWGFNMHGEVGDGTTTNRNTPMDVIGMDRDVVAVVGGFNHTCALTGSGGVKCWGDNTYGQLGDGSFASSNLPVNVAGLDRGVVSLKAGMFHNCALLDTGGVKCWGMKGQVGAPVADDAGTPVDVFMLTTGVKAIALGLDHSCALLAEGGMKCWGNGRQGQLGVRLDIDQDSRTWVQVPDAPSDLAGIAAGEYNTCAIKTDGGLACWGSNENRMLGKNPYGKKLEDRTSYSPVEMTGLKGDVDEVGIGSTFMCALLKDGRIQCWGTNYSGVLGYGNVQSSYIPVFVRGFDKANP